MRARRRAESKMTEGRWLAHLDAAASASPKKNHGEAKFICFQRDRQLIHGFGEGSCL